MRNLKYTHKIGEVGTRIEFTLENGDPATTVDLSSWTVTLNASKSGIITLDDEPVTQLNQTTARGECYFTFTALNTDLAKGSHKMNLKLTNGGNVEYWPKDKNGERTYGTIIVQEPID